MILRVTKIGEAFLVLNITKWKNVFGLIEDPQLTIEQLQISIHVPYTQEVILKR